MKTELFGAIVLALVLGPMPLPAADTESSEVTDRLVGLSLRSPFLREAADDFLDGIGPRPAGTVNGTRAERLAIEVFRHAGLPLVRAEAVTVPVWQARRASLTLVEPTVWVIPGLPLPHSGATPEEGLVVPVVDGGAGTATELAELGDRVEGAAVLIDWPPPSTSGGQRHLAERYQEAVAAGAAVLLITPQKLDRLPAPVPLALSESGDAIPAFAIPATAGAWLRRLAASQRTPRLSTTLEVETGQVQASTIVADLPGRDPEEMIVVGAPLHSWGSGQGALDGGTGILVLWQMARALVEQGQRPLRSIRFVCFAGDGVGLIGSRAFVSNHEHELTAIRAMINLQLVGEPVGFGTMLQPDLEPTLAQLARSLAGFGLESRVPHRPILRSDHQPFFERGVPVVTLRTGIDEHALAAAGTWRDFRDLIDLGRLQRASAVAAALVWTLANSEPLPTQHLSPEAVQEAMGEAEPANPVDTGTPAQD
jgi:Zn-dependent M28 family amino/carboxypeptidase